MADAILAPREMPIPGATAVVRAERPSIPASKEDPDPMICPNGVKWADIALAVIGLRVLLTVIGAGIHLLLPPAHQAGGLQGVLLEPWRQFDALRFTEIAAHGYTAGSLNTAYLPLYPLTIRAAALLTFGHYLSAALLVSGVACVIGAGLFWRWVADLFDARVAWRALTVLLLFPDSFFLLGAYSEALFLALSCGCLLASHRRRPLLAGVLATLATLTRLQGLVLVVPMALDLWTQRRRTVSRGVMGAVGAPVESAIVPATGHPQGVPLHQPSVVPATGRPRGEPLRGVAALMLPVAGLLVYQRILTARLGGGSIVDTFQHRWHITLQTPWQTLWQYVTVIRSPRWHLIHSPQANYILLWDLLIALLVLGTLLASARRLGLPLTLYGLAAWCFALSRWYSTGRYMLAVLPFFIAVGLWAEGPRLRRITMLSLLVLVFFTAEFVQGSWVD